MGNAGREQNAREVFEILVHEHADMLEAYLRTVLGPDSSIDDIFQEAILVAWVRLADYDRSRPFAAWLRGIAHVLVMEHARKRRARPATMDPGVLSEIDLRFETLSRLPGDAFRDRAEHLLRCLDKLPDAMREALNLVHARGLSVAAAAGSVGATVESLKKRVQRGRRLLADCLGVGEAPP